MQLILQQRYQGCKTTTTKVQSGIKVALLKKVAPGKKVMPGREICIAYKCFPNGYISNMMLYVGIYSTNGALNKLNQYKPILTIKE